MQFSGKMPRVEVRKMNENGQVVVGNVTEYNTAQSRPGTSSSGSGSSAYASDWIDENERDDDEDYAEGDFGEDRGDHQSWGRSDAPILLYLHEVITIHSFTHPSLEFTLHPVLFQLLKVVMSLGLHLLFFQLILVIHMSGSVSDQESILVFILNLIFYTFSSGDAY